MGADGIVVVAWALRATSQGRAWQRFTSPSVTSKNGLQAAWDAAERWARTPLPDDAARTVTLFSVSSWQVFYFRDNAWTNPQSSTGDVVDGAAKLPDGVQLVLDLPLGGEANGEKSALAGKLTKYWIAPTLGATR